MQEHEKILQMIEQVKPDDTAMLDEIDARVSCYIHPHIELVEYNNGACHAIRNSDGFTGMPPQYTRSRDALKAIRPDGWDVLCFQQYEGENSFELMTLDNKVRTKEYLKFPTEELAELHAIIQAIAYERGQENEQV